jgi:hypothetical protein
MREDVSRALRKPTAVPMGCCSSLAAEISYARNGLGKSLESAEPDSYHRRIIGVELQAAVRFVAVPKAQGLTDSVLI